MPKYIHIKCRLHNKSEVKCSFKCFNDESFLRFGTVRIWSKNRLTNEIIIFILIDLPFGRCRHCKLKGTKWLALHGLVRFVSITTESFVFECFHSVPWDWNDKGHGSHVGVGDQMCRQVQTLHRNNYDMFLLHATHKWTRWLPLWVIWVWYHGKKFWRVSFPLHVAISYWGSAGYSTWINNSKQYERVQWFHLKVCKLFLSTARNILLNSYLKHKYKNDWLGAFENIINILLSL